MVDSINDIGKPILRSVDAFYLCRSISKGLDSINLFVATWLSSSMNIDQSETAIWPHSAHGAQGGGTPLWTPLDQLLYSTAPLLHLEFVQFCSYPALILILSWFLSLAPLCQSLWIPVLVKNVIIDSNVDIWNLLNLVWKTFAEWGSSFLEGLKKNLGSPCASGYDLH